MGVIITVSRSTLVRGGGVQHVTRSARISLDTSLWSRTRGGCGKHAKQCLHIRDPSANHRRMKVMGWGIIAVWKYSNSANALPGHQYSKLVPPVSFGSQLHWVYIYLKTRRLTYKPGRSVPSQGTKLLQIITPRQRPRRQPCSTPTVH